MLKAFKYIPDLLFVQPLRTLYFYGPRFWGWGGWEGIATEDICAQLTLVSAQVWKDQPLNCAALIERKFHTLLVTVGGLAYFLLIYKILTYIYFRYFILGPLLSEIKRILPMYYQQEPPPQLLKN